jgi:STE24 endopeptidase
LTSSLYDLAGLIFPELVEIEAFKATVSLLLLTLTIVLLPMIVRYLWDTEPLAPGLLRSRLQAASERLGIRCSEILVWRTRSGLVNAMVTGILPVPRYVLLSDALIEQLTPEEIEAVFGHEIGHIRHRHMLLYLVFMGLSVMSICVAAERLLPRMIQGMQTEWSQAIAEPGEPNRETIQEVHTASAGPIEVNFPGYLAMFTGWGTGAFLVGGYVWLVFGFLSRRCERQADVFGCRAVSYLDSNASADSCAGKVPPLTETGIRVFISALEKVADLNGIDRKQPSWRHSSIARRVAFLKKLIKSPSVEPGFQRRMRLFHVAWLIVLATGWVVVALV